MATENFITLDKLYISYNRSHLGSSSKVHRNMYSRRREPAQQAAAAGRGRQPAQPQQQATIPRSPPPCLPPPPLPSPFNDFYPSTTSFPNDSHPSTSPIPQRNHPSTTSPLNNSSPKFRHSLNDVIPQRLLNDSQTALNATKPTTRSHLVSSHTQLSSDSAESSKIFTMSAESQAESPEFSAEQKKRIE